MKGFRFPIVLFAVAVALAGCKLKDEAPPPGSGPPPIPAPADVAAPPKDALITPSGIASKVLQVGLGSIHPRPTQTITAHYTGWTADGQMFDSSYRAGRPLEIPLNKVIPGWQEAIQLMVIGEKRRFWIPGRLAYDGQPGSPQGQLCFEIELLDIKY
jgi:FKBP-type peptidyl-prolyl cis-trans isomerase